MKKTFGVLTILVSAWASLLIMDGSPVSGADIYEPWTTVGSAGTVDEADLLSVFLGSPLPGDVRIRDGIRAGTVIVRYNIVAVDGLMMGHSGYSLFARFRDKGDDEQVVLKLVQYNLDSGIALNLLRLDSDSFPPADGYQVQGVSTYESQGCLPEGTKLFDFERNAYYIEASIKKTALRGNPVLSIIKLATWSCIPWPIDQ